MRLSHITTLAQLQAIITTLEPEEWAVLTPAARAAIDARYDELEAEEAAGMQAADEVEALVEQLWPSPKGTRTEAW